MGIFDKLKAKDASKTSTSKTNVESGKKSATIKTDSKKKEAKQSKPNTFAHRVLLQPVLTEKSLKAQTVGVYTFFVALQATKKQVFSAVKEVYGIAPLSVNMIRQNPKSVYRWGKKIGSRNETKKAIVKMPKGSMITFTE